MNKLKVLADVKSPEKHVSLRHVETQAEGLRDYTVEEYKKEQIQKL